MFMVLKIYKKNYKEGVIKSFSRLQRETHIKMWIMHTKYSNNTYLFFY